MTRLIVHIGSQKTGSTSVQAFLAANAERLAAQGVNFIAAGRKRESHNHVAITEHNGDVAPLMAGIVEEITSAPERTHLLSSEMFFRPSMAQAFDEHLPDWLKTETRVVAYIRRQDKFLEAMYKQMVKNNRFRGSLEAYAERKRDALRYSTVLDAFATVFGHDAMVVRPFERKNFPERNVVLDFARNIGMDDVSSADLPEENSNVTLSREVSELLGQINRTTDINTRQLIREMSRHPTEGAVRSNDCYLPSQKRRIMQEVADDNALVHASYCSDLPKLFSLSDLDPDTSDAPPSDAEKLKRLHQALFAVFRAIGKTHVTNTK